MAYCNAFDKYRENHILSAIENLFTEYINSKVDKYLKILQD